MNALRKRNWAEPQTSGYSVELRQRVERLEQERVHACMHREREAVDLIDQQIKQAIAEWSGSFVVEEFAERVRKAG